MAFLNEVKVVFPLQKKNKKITDFNQLAPNMLSALAGLILHSCGF